MILLLTILAPPSKFAAWAVPALRSLAEAALGDLDYIHVTTIDQFRDDWRNRKFENLMLFSDCPDIELGRILGKNEGPTILLREDPAAVATHVKDFSSQTPISAARIASVSFSALHDVALACLGLMVLSQDRSPEALLRAAIRFFGLTVPDAKIKEVAVRVGAPIELPTKAAVEGAETKNALTAMFLSDDLIMSLAPFASIYEGEAPKSFTWSRSLFLGVDQVGAPTDASLESEIDLTGPARILFYGPYFHLPRGEWLLTAEFHVADNLSGNKLNIDVMAGLDVVTQGTTALPTRGSYEFRLPFAVAEPREAIQLRFATMEGAIEGKLAFEGVTISRPDAAEAELIPAA